MNRSELAQQIVALLSPHAYPFGGYLRDNIAGVEFTDIDFFAPQHDHNYVAIGTYALRRVLKMAGFDVELLDHKKIYNKTTGMRLEKDVYSIIDPDSGIQIKIDVVRNKDGCEWQDHPFTSLDADVNSLWFNKMSGTMEVAPCVSYMDGYTFEEIYANIRNRVFNLPEDFEINTSRITKLLEKGYSPKNARRKTWEASDTAINSHIFQEKLGEEKEDTMTTTRPTFAAQFKSDMEKAAYRSCGTQMTNATKQGILTLVKSNGADEGALAFIAKMLDTEGGTAFVSCMLGHGLPHAPVIGADPRVVRLTEEFRVAGYAQGMNLLFSALVQYVMPGVLAALQSLPPVTESDMAELTTIQNAKMRVSGHSDPIPDLTFRAEKEAEAEMEGVRRMTRTA
jgi:hypothetical protein